jgi:ribosomal protein L7/L12
LIAEWRKTMFSDSNNSAYLQYQIKRVEEKIDLLLRHAGITMPIDPLTTQVQELLRTNQKIQAIKLYRQATGAGLKDAKEWIEAIENS